MDTPLRIYKQDGTLQCEPDVHPRPLQQDRETIEGLGITVIGDGQHITLPVVVVAMCHTPTAWANVFEISQTGLTREQLRELAGLGFQVWDFPRERQRVERTA